jgi:hypothetical protein
MLKSLEAFSEQDISVKIKIGTVITVGFYPSKQSYCYSVDTKNIDTQYYHNSELEQAVNYIASILEWS